MSSYKKFKLGNKTLKLKFDTDAESPRQWDNLSKLIFVGKHKHLGDAHSFDVGNGHYESRDHFMEQGAKDVTKYLKSQGEDVAYITPVHLYEHSGSTISTSYSGQYADKWDSGTCGFAVITRQAIKENWSVGRVSKKDIAKAIDILEGEIATLDTYLRGDVFGFVLKEDGEETDSCWGFFGDDILTNGIMDHIGEEWREVITNNQ